MLFPMISYVSVAVQFIFVNIHRMMSVGKWVLPITDHWGPEGESRYSPTLSWPLHLDGRGWPRPLYPRERPGIHCTEGWVGPRAGLDGCGKSRPPLGFYPRTVQPVASRYTDWAVAARLGYMPIAKTREPVLSMVTVYSPFFSVLRRIFSRF